MWVSYEGFKNVRFKKSNLWIGLQITIIAINIGVNYYNNKSDSTVCLIITVVNAKALFIMRCSEDINTQHNMKSIGRAAVAQWTKRLTLNGQTQVRIREAHIFDFT